MTTGRIEAKRLKDDNYITPFWAIEVMVPHLKKLCRTREGYLDILEPGAGTGNIGRVLRATYPKAAIFGIEKRRLSARTIRKPYSVYTNKTDFLSWPGPRAKAKLFDLCMMNPPYKLAFEFIWHSLELSRTVVALLKLDFLASQGRAEWMRKNTPAVYVIPKRPSFTPDGETDWHNYGWFVWRSPRATNALDPRIHILRIP
jgi:hypothetical protein